ncbi:hypothetical protein BJV74DRAFT_137192 [Russula compacta]|nr:hypothetical protein BJV74DRAFT_137192 [Russula compacta]
MNPWHLEEICQATKLHCFTNAQQNRATDMFINYGPIPGICIDFVSDSSLLRAYEDHHQTIVSGLTEDSLLRLVLNGGDLDLEPESHTIFMIKRDEVDDLERAHVEPISAQVEMQLIAAIDTLPQFKRISLHQSLAYVPTERVVAGLVYESLAHTLFQEGVTLTLKPTIKQAPGRQRQKYFHWKSSIEHASNSADVDNSEISVTLPANTAIMYDKLTSVEPNHLHVPMARNQVGLNSFLKLGETLYIFQFTTAEKHNVEEKMEESHSKSGLLDVLPAKANWEFVFITPGHEVDVMATPAVEKFLQGVKLYWAHLELGQRFKLMVAPGHCPEESLSIAGRVSV